MFQRIMAPVDLAHIERLGAALVCAADLAKHWGVPIVYVGVTSSAPSELAHNPEEFGQKLGAFADAEAAKHGAHTLGIRPEHIDVVSEGGLWQGTVGVSEHLGSDTFFHINDTGLGVTLTVRAPGEVDFKHGDRISLSPREDQFHRFDKEGLRIG